MPTPTVINQWRWSDAISRNFWDGNYQYENWKQAPISSCKTGGATSPTLTNVLYSPNIQLEFEPLSTQVAPTLAPQIVTVSEGISGLDIGMTQTDDVGVELCPGILNANHMAFKIGEANAFFFRVKFSIADVSGTDDCAIGFRKVEAYQANIDDYTDIAVLNVISGDIKIETILAGAATVTTDTTQNWADTEVHQLEVFVSSTGVVTYTIDNVAPVVTAAYTFTNNLYVVPFFYFLNSADLAGAVVIQEWECGYQS